MNKSGELLKYGIFLVIFLIPFQLYFKLYKNLSISAAEILAIILFAVTLLQFISGTWNFNAVPCRLGVAVIVFIFVMGLSIFVSNDKYQSVKYFLKWMSAISLFFSVYENIDSLKSIKLSMLFAFIVAAVISVIGMVEYSAGIYKVLAWIKGNSLAYIIIEPDTLREKMLNGTSNWVIWSNNLPHIRVFGTFDDVISFSAYLGLLIPFVLFLLNRSKVRSMFLPGAVSILLLITLALTFTRSAALGFAAMMITFMIIAFRNNTLRKPVLILLIIVAVSLISLIAYKPVNDSIKLHFYQTMQQHIADRKQFWTDGMNVFMARPILGVGIANYRNGLLEYAGKDAVLVPSHNQYIQLAAETGAIGFLSYLLILFYGFKLSVEMSAKAADPTIKLMAACFLGIWAWYCIQSFFSTYLFDDKFSMMFWLMLGINAALFRIYTVSLKADTDTIIRR